MLLTAWAAVAWPGEEAVQREFQAKAAFVCNCPRFLVGGRFGPADGEDSSPADPNRILRVGIVGPTPAPDCFAAWAGRRVRDRRIEVRFFPGFSELKDAPGKIPEQYPQMSALRKCHVLFLCRSEAPLPARFLPDLQQDGLLLIGEAPGFLEAGGMINLVKKDEQVRFEINLVATGQARLRIRSRLLRLALRTIQHDSLERQKDEGKPTPHKGS